MNRALIIAEAGVNHNGSLDMAMQLVEVAAQAGADIVKFQTFRAQDIVTTTAQKAGYQKKQTGENESQFEMIRRLELSPEHHFALKAHSEKLGIEFLSTPFDESSLDFLVKEVQIKRLKVASGEIVNGPFLLRMARTGKPIILSTGMSDLKDIETALSVLAFGFLNSSGSPDSAALKSAFQSNEAQKLIQERVTILQCTTEYPASYEDAHLNTMATLRKKFGVKVGLSDHTVGVTVPLAAIALGAEVIEKHFTLDRKLPGPDHSASLEPDEIRFLIRGIRQVEKALGSSEKKATPVEKENQKVVRKSLVAAHPIKKGEAFSQENLRVKRPGTGLSPMQYWDCLGKTAPRDFERDELIEL